MTPLEEIIRDEIRLGGPMRFDRFMELALYHPQLGYYTRPEALRAIGRGGDYITSVSVGPLFGRLLARQFRQMWELLGRPDPFWIVEQGAHDGQLARDILEWCRNEAPQLFIAARYAIVRGPHVDGTHAVASLDTLAAEKPVGVFFSNELVDAFPVRVVRFVDGAWRERQVEIDGGAFRWTDRPADAEVRDQIAALALPEIEGFTTEVHARAGEWMAQVALALRRGYVLTLDYGYPASLYYAPFRLAGTLTSYTKHRRGGDVLADPGGQDITAHVNFTGLARAGEAAGLTTLGLVDQQHFLMGIGHDELSGANVPRAGVAQNIRAWQTLTHPDYLGAKFFALVQAREAPAQLDGLRYTRPGALE